MTSAREVIAAKVLPFVKDVLRDYDVPEDAFRGDPELAESCNLLADEVDAHIAEAVAGERERCARVADMTAHYHRTTVKLSLPISSGPIVEEDRAKIADRIAAAIRGDDHDG